LPAAPGPGGRVVAAVGAVTDLDVARARADHSPRWRRLEAWAGPMLTFDGVDHGGGRGAL
jgi:hypothetical protein